MQVPMNSSRILLDQEVLFEEINNILIPVQSENLGNAKALGFQRSKMGPYTHMKQFLIVETRELSHCPNSHFGLG